MDIVLLNTLPEYGQQYWVDNIKYMLDNVEAEYDDICVVTDVEYGGVYDKLRLFDLFRERKYLYFDLDVIIRRDISHLWRDDFTLIKAWWRPAFHTPLNSSIMSWSGDYSHIHDKFAEDPEYWMVKYWKGMDEFIYNEIEYKTYDKVCDSFNWPSDGTGYGITLYNQAKDAIWAHECSLSVPEISTDQKSKNTSILRYQT